MLADGRVVVALRNRNRLAVLEPTEDADQALDEICTVPTRVKPWAWRRARTMGWCS